MSVKDRKEEARGIEETYISDTTYANVVLSGIAGWFDRYPRIPYGRATAYTQNSYDKFKLSFPFLQTLDRGFAALLPTRHAAQRGRRRPNRPAAGYRSRRASAAQGQAGRQARARLLRAE